MKAAAVGFLVALTIGGIEPLASGLGRQPAVPKRYVIRGMKPTCATCDIELVKLTSVGAETEPEILARGSVVVDQRGRTLAWTMADQHVVFDSSGHRLAVFGRKGRGPGEFERVEGETFDMADTLYTFEPGMGRVTVYSPDYQFVRTAPFPSNPMTEAVALGDDRFVLVASGTRPTPGHPRERLAEPLHLVSEGKIVRSFGTDAVPAPGSVGENEETYRRVGLSTQGRVWSVQVARYIIERWDTAGTQELSIVREVEWFPTVKLTYADPTQVRPTPTVTGVWEDAKGRVWTIIQVADANWRTHDPAKQSAIGRGSIGRVPVDLVDSLYDSIVEVFDPEQGVLLASRRFPQSLNLSGRGFAYCSRVTKDGAYKKEIWKIQMRDARTSTAKPRK